MTVRVGRWIGWSASGLLVALGTWLVVRPKPVPCDVANLDRGQLIATVDRDGRTRLKDRYVVSAPLEGRIDRITLRPGDAVVADRTTLARISAPAPPLLDDRARAQAAARLGFAEAAVSRATANLEGAEDDLAHLQSTSAYLQTAEAQGAATRRELEDEMALLRAAEHALDTARFAHRMACWELEQAQAALRLFVVSADAPTDSVFEVRSPIDGTVLRVLRESAGVVAAGEPLVEVGSLDALEVEVDVLSNQAVGIRPGAAVQLERWGGEAPLAGRVRLVEPSGFTKISALGVEEQRVNVIVDFEDPLDARRGLGDGFRVEARIVVGTSDDALRAPIGALIRHGSEWAVFAVEDGVARLRPVVVGLRSDRHAEILDGLPEGATVIVFPGDRIAEGVRVTPRGPSG
jgi:HlyD family secretion protein